jgi:hypothetical protein
MCPSFFMWDSLFRAVDSVEHEETAVGIFGVVAGSAAADGSAWASLRRVLIWHDAGEFYFEFDERLRLGDTVSIRYADHDFGMVTVFRIVKAVDDCHGRRRLYVGMDQAEQHLSFKQRSVAMVLHPRWVALAA